jgi:hypothetical protein
MKGANMTITISGGITSKPHPNVVASSATIPKVMQRRERCAGG